MFVLEQRIVINQPCSSVYRYIRQPGRLAALQPFIVAIEHADGDAARPHGSLDGPGDGPFFYRAIERVPVAGGRFALRNVVEIEQTNDDEGQRCVTSVVRVKGPVPMGGLLAVSGVNTLTLTPIEEATPDGPRQSTLVVDRFEFHRYPSLLRPVIAAEATKAHRTLLERLKAALEKTAEAPIGAPIHAGKEPGSLFHEHAFPAGWFAACPVAELPENGVLIRTLLGHPTLLTKTPDGLPLCVRIPERHVDDLRHATWVGRRLVGIGRALRLDGATLVTEHREHGEYGEEYSEQEGLPCDVRPVHDFLGVLLFWHADKGSALQPFALPHWSSEHVTPYAFRYFPRVVHTTVKEITEDIADLHHFGAGGHRWSDVVVHGFDTSSDISTLDMSFTMETSVFGRFRDQMRLHGHFEAIGVGLFIGSVKSEQRDLDTRPLICYTPTTSPRHIQLIYGESHRRMQDPGRLHKLLGLLPRRAADRAITLQALRAMDKDVTFCDVNRWETPSYIRERRERSDRLLLDYRGWVTRFYADAAHAAIETTPDIAMETECPS